MPAAGGQAGGGLGVGLFHEPGDRVHAGRARQFGADLDIAVAGFRRGRLHAERDDLARPSGDRGGPQAPRAARPCR